jgi:hypothetical protein
MIVYMKETIEYTGTKKKDLLNHDSIGLFF